VSKKNKHNKPQIEQKPAKPVTTVEAVTSAPAVATVTETPATVTVSPEIDKQQGGVTVVISSTVLG